MSSITLEKKDVKVEAAKKRVKEAEKNVKEAKEYVASAEEEVNEAEKMVEKAELKVQSAEKKVEVAEDEGKGQSVIVRLAKSVDRCQRVFDTHQQHHAAVVHKLSLANQEHALAIQALALALQNLEVAQKNRKTLDVTNRLIARIDGIRKQAALHYDVWDANGKCQCQISGRWGDNKQVTTSHLLKHCTPLHLKNVFKIDDIDDFRNLLLLATGIDKAYEQGRVYFEFVNERTFVMKIYDDTVKKEPIFAGSDKTVGEFEGCKLKIPCGVEPPCKRVLSHHAQMAYKNALQKKWIDRNTVVRPEEYGSPLKDNMLSFSQIDSVEVEEDLSWKGSFLKDDKCSRSSTQTETGDFSEDA